MPASAARPVTPPAGAAAESARAKVPPRRASTTGPCSAAPPPPSGGRSPPTPPAVRRTGTATRRPRRSSAAASPSPASAAERALPPAPPHTLSHGGGTLGGGLGRRPHHPRTQGPVWRVGPVKRGQVHAPRRHHRQQPLHQFLRGEDQDLPLPRAVLEAPVLSPRQPLVSDQPPAPVPAPLERRRGARRLLQGKARGQLRRPLRLLLQREQNHHDVRRRDAAVSAQGVD